YLHVGVRQHEHAAESLKRFFYALRPAAALRWLDDHPDEKLPPMDLPTLLAEADVSDDIRHATAELIAAKAVTRELGTGAPAEVLQQFVAEELARAAVYDRRRTKPSEQARERAEEFFRAELA